ncbi:MAG: nicotinate phosphoribosyltransferase [Corynebacterium glucuronolyticum]|nr:nicotinate phosphoribosyltransferase [Corynebacterium glucuronolyticum]MDD7586746.1 nicotinate phosphoribosyltransferase [Mycobacteriaceae bacterium]MDY5833395.1 nicotinate phosphoribosyltransferase [Corynebacterium glucuronolyticum]
MQNKSSALFTDMYELTMLQASLRDGTANRQCAFEVFTRRLTNQRRYGVVAGTTRVLEAVKDFVFSEEQLASLDFLDEETIEYLRNYRFSGDIDGYQEGELYFPNSPLLTVRGTFAECVVLETVVLSIMNADSTVATAAARMVVAADGRPIIEMGSRRTHEYNAVTAARAAYLAGFTATSNLEASYRYGIPASGTAAHAWTLVHVNPDGTPNEEAAFRSQIETMGIDTVLLVDTYDIDKGVRTAIDVAGPKLGGIRIDSGDLGPMTRRVRKLLDELGAVDTKIVVSSDLDEFTMAGLRGDPVDSFGVGTSVVTGSGAPTAEMVYKLVEVDGIPVAKRSASKKTLPGAKRAIRTSRASGTCVEEIVFPFYNEIPDVGNFHYKELTQPLMRDGEVVDGQPTLEESRQLLADNLVSLPWEGLALSKDEPAIGTRFVGF